MMKIANPIRHRGFTLMELIVVLAIIAILIGLLLPAISSVRESANKISCRNNLKQIGLGWSMHTSTLGYFPLGASYAPKYEAPGQPTPVGEYVWQAWGSWMFQILPYEGYENQYYQSNAKDADEALANLVSTPIPIYFCPSRSREKTFIIDEVFYTEPQRRRASNDYAANGGDNTADGVFRPVPFIRGWKKYLKINESVITDGLSNTIFVAEKRIQRSFYKGPNWILSGGFVSDSDCKYRSTNGFGNAPNVPKPDSFHREKNVSYESGSAHSQGMFAVAGDGSVHFISYTIDPQLWVRLCSRSDGEAASFID